MASKELKYGIIITAVDKATAALTTVQNGFKGIEAFGARLAKVGEGVRDARENVEQLLGGVEGHIKSVLEAADGVDESFARLRVTTSALLPANSKLLEDARERALAWSSTHTQSAEEYLSATNAIIRAGVDQAQVLDSVDAAMAVARATGADAAGTAKTLAAVYAQVGDKGLDARFEMTRLGDQLVRLSQIFPEVKVEELTDPLKDALPAAQKAKVDFAQLTTVIGQFNAMGIKGGEAGAATANLINALGPASEKLGFALSKTSDGGLDLVKTLKGLEAQYGSVERMPPEVSAALAEAFGPDVFKGLSLMLGQTDKLSSALAKVEESSGAAGVAQRELDATRAAQAQITENAVKALKVEVAAGLAPAITALTPTINSVIQAFGGFAREHPNIVAVGGAIGGVGYVALKGVHSVLSFAGAIGGAGKALETVGSLGSAFTGGIGKMAAAASDYAVTLGTRVVAATASALQATWAWVSAMAQSVVTAVASAVKGALTWAATLATNVASAVAGAVTGAITWATTMATTVVGSLATAATSALAWAATMAGAVVTAIGSAITATLAWTAALLTNPITWIVIAVIAAVALIYIYWEPISEFFIALWDEISAAFSSAWDWIVSIWDGAVAWVTGIYDGIKAAFEDGVINGILTLLKEFSPLALIMKAFDSVLQWLTGYSLADAGSNIINTIVDGMKAAANAPVEVMTSIVQKVRNLLPFSPAKAGPLKDLHKVKLVETVADSVEPDPLVSAMTRVTGDTMAVLRDPQPIPEGMLASGGPRGGGSYAGASSAPMPGASQAAPQITMQVYIDGAKDPQGVLDAFRAFLRNPADAQLVADAVERMQAMRARAVLT